MSAVWVVAGAAVIAFGICDLFLTVLHYESPGLVTLRAYSVAWKGARWSTAPLPPRARAFTRSMVAPALVVVQIAVWLGLQVVGFALLYYPAISSHHFVVGRTGHSFGTTLYFSAASLTSLSFSDVEPRSLAYHSVAAAETLVGLGILTLTISYVLNLYRVLQ
ncbi:MAG TPA: ion channel, partial [Acidimicrobiales bacterium]|nr:ion channel [Acidimicrobiales bacterium]